MKTILSVFALASVLTMGSAQAAQGNIHSIFCHAGEIGVGSVTVTFTGLETFNITETNAFGMPFTQQATIRSVDYDRKTITFRLYGSVTGLTYTLALKNGTSQGTMSTKYGSMNLACKANIDIN